MADVEKLKEKKRQLEAKIRKIEAVETQKKRKDDTRRKIIIGSLVLAEAESDPKLRKWLDGVIDRKLINDRDRELFGLPLQKTINL